ncbi:MAG TPA: hypothetical protein VF103_07390 [Polyangiaceae bacterium]
MRLLPRTVPGTLSVLVALVCFASAPAADAKGKKTGSSSKKKKKGGSMDDHAGEAKDGLAPGADDAKSKEPEKTETKDTAAGKGSETTDANSSDVTVETVAEAPKEEAAPEPEPSGPKQNWVQLGVQQEFMLFTPVSNVCESTDAEGNVTPGASGYSCRDVYGIYPGNVYSGSGNEIQGGLGIATTRILIGYDRVFIDRLTIGGRVGFAFNGAPTVPGGGTFNPFHAELKSAFYFGNKPFERDGIRPYASLAAGIGEVDAKVSVDFFVDQEGYQNGKRGHLDAWRKTGIAFGAVGLGAGYPIGPIMPTLEMRGVMMFGEPAFVLALAGNVAYGF